MSTPTADARNGYSNDPADYWEVEAAANRLVKQGRSLGNRHLMDPGIRAQFNMEVANCAKKTVREVESGEKTITEGLQQIYREAAELFQQSNDIAAKVAGIVAGGMQIKTGISVCRSAPACVVFGVPLIAHGANNIYENVDNLITGRSDAEGWVRKGYQEVAKKIGYGKKEGNLAYASVDMGLSAFALGRNVLKPGAWKLFRYVYSDFEKTYRTMGKLSLAFEVYVNFQTGKQMYKEVGSD